MDRNKEAPMRRLLPLSCALAVLVSAACQDALVAPDVNPQFLIGNSPLTPITLDVSNPDDPRLIAEVLVNRGITEVAIEDKFLVRVSGEFKLPDGGSAGAICQQDFALTGQKDTGVRDGSDVGFIMDIDIPAPTWDAIKDLDKVAVQLLAELVMTTGSGSEKILDSVTLAGDIDPGLGGY
jgi:hypothetical protein